MTQEPRKLTFFECARGSLTADEVMAIMEASAKKFLKDPEAFLRTHHADYGSVLTDKSRALAALVQFSEPMTDAKELATILTDSRSCAVVPAQQGVEHPVYYVAWISN